MNKLKTKINTKGRKTEITIYEGRDAIEKIVRYHNSCMVCGATSFGDADLGADHICPICTELLKKRFASRPVENMEVVEKVETKEKPVAVKAKKKRAKVHNRTFTVTKEYHPDIKIVDFVSYSNLMTHHKVNEKLATTIIDLVLKGVNTPIKIHKILNQYKLDCLCIYLAVMSKVGMLQPMPFERVKGNKYNRIFKLHKNLLYTTAE